MSDNMASLRHKIDTAGDLQAVVRTMKALAASGIGQYERSVRSLADYHRTVELALGACVRERPPGGPQATRHSPSDAGPIGVVVFGSDQGLVGQFNEVIADFAVATLAGLAGTPHVWAVGDRVQARLSDAGISVRKVFAVPTSVEAIAPLVGQIQIESEGQRASDAYERVYVFHNGPRPGAVFEPLGQRLLPLDTLWEQEHAKIRWPTRNVPQVLSGGPATLRALIREYLFISLFRACAESLASENASRLAAMERADKNIDELRESLTGTFHRLRQSSIDEELFDVVSGYQSLARVRGSEWPGGEAQPDRGMRKS